MTQEIINDLQQRVYQLTYELDDALQRKEYYKAESEKLEERYTKAKSLLAQQKAKEEMYDLMFKIAEEHPMVKSAFMDFMMTLKLVDDTAEDKFLSIQKEQGKWL